MSLAERFAELAGELGRIEESLADLTFEALRNQLHGDDEAKELEKRLARARRSVAKAKGLLEGRG